MRNRILPLLALAGVLSLSGCGKHPSLERAVSPSQTSSPKKSLSYDPLMEIGNPKDYTLTFDSSQEFSGGISRAERTTDGLKVILSRDLGGKVRASPYCLVRVKTDTGVFYSRDIAGSEDAFFADSEGKGKGTYRDIVRATSSGDVNEVSVVMFDPIKKEMICLASYKLGN